MIDGRADNRGDGRGDGRSDGEGGVNSHWTCDTLTQKGDWTGKAFTSTEREPAACLMVIVKV